jgi:phosphoribosylformimino-5-aminoimidazole carboxamide ribotide isomerase
MNSFTIFPAIDLRHGRCVRLRQGDPEAETVFGDDPAAVARRWADQGATWLHVVNLDGAFASDRHAVTPDDRGALPLNLQRLVDICLAVDLPVQFGGGLRTIEDVALALELGATRVVLGTAALQNPELVTAALQRFGPAQIVVGIDARAGMVATHGWLETSPVTAHELAQRVARLGVQHVVYTNIARDGMLSGVDAAGTATLARESGLAVIASGGVRDLDDIRQLLAVRADGVAGVIAGQALYTGSLHLPAALALVQNTPAAR